MFIFNRETHFKNKKVEIICEKLGITQVFSTIQYHPRNNGSTELGNL